MKRIKVSPAWSFEDESGQRLDPQLFVLLAAVHECGKLTAAARLSGISYRHGWNLLNRWAAFFGADLVTLQKGRGATLTALGEKLLWAQQRVKARFEPQLKSLASELNLEIQRNLEGGSPLLRLHASHGYAVDLLPEFAAGLQLDLQYTSEERALEAMAAGACDVAGFHVPTDVLSERLIATFRRHLQPRCHRIVRFINRRQGLIVRPGNPRAIAGLADLARAGVRFINRQRNSGTRALLDELLRRADVASAGIDGFGSEEYTHSAIAAYVAAGMADAGFGVKAAASQFGLDFIELASEHYLLVCHRSMLKRAAMIRLLRNIRSEAFSAAVARLPGYSADSPGEVQCISEVMPWF